MQTKRYRRVSFAFTAAVVIVELLIIIGMVVYVTGESDQSIKEMNYIWVDFDVTGTIRVEVLDTNGGEVPDEAWEEVERVLGEFANYASMNLDIKGYGTYGEVIMP